MKHVFIFAVLVISLASCVSPTDKAFSKLPPGIWRGVLLLDNEPILATNEDEEVSFKIDRQGELPFNFEVVYDSQDSFHIDIINGDERISVTDITYGLDRSTAKDTIIIDFPIYDTYIKAIYEEDIMEGRWYVNYKEGYSIPFKAYYGQNHRFSTVHTEPATDLSGKWSTIFEAGTEDSYPAIGEFEAKGNDLSGTFLTETGDYRYLAGEVQGNKLYMSTFDGAHAFLFLAKILEDGSLTGIFRSGSHYISNWEATKDNSIELGNALDLTTPVGDEPMTFTFPNTSSQQISLSDDAYQGKIKIIEVMGTWCPNCKDATDYLKRYHSDKPDDVEIISIAYERYAEAEKNIAQLEQYKTKSQIPWEVLLGGSYRKSEASKTLPQLSGILSYPTLIFVDKANRIRYIHTGFSGPATSEYEAFNKTFKNIMERLTAM